MYYDSITNHCQYIELPNQNILVSKLDKKII